MYNKTFHSSYKYLLSFLILFGLNACIDPYDANFGQDNKVLVVEGLLTNDFQNPDTLKIQYSYYLDGYVYKKPIAGTKASIVTSTGQEIKLISVGTEGGFLPPATFRINPAEKYNLKFSLGDGNNYESTPQQILQTPTIDKVYDIFNPTSKLSNDGKTVSSNSEIFVDFQDKGGEKNYYMWRYTHYERLDYCITCDPNTLYKIPSQSCVSNQFSYQRNPPYDYRCLGGCFTILKSTKPNILSDITSDGRLVKGRLVAQIPLYSLNPCLVVVQQMSVSPEIYGLNKLLESQSSATGSLADTPAATIIGNIKNLSNSAEKIVGYFGIVDLKTNRYWMTRDNASGQIAYILGHKPDEEPAPPPPAGVPQAPCKPGKYRTPIKPEGWKN